MIASPDFLTNLSSWATPPNDLVSTVWNDGRAIVAQRSQQTVHLSNLSVCYPGWSYSNPIAVDLRRSYEFGIWVRSSTTQMANYFGFYAYDAHGKRISGDWTNPYFKTSRGDVDGWVYHSGYLLAAATSNTSATFGISATDGTDWVMPSNTFTVVLRFGSCYGQGNGLDYALYAYPSVRELSPTTISAINNRINTLVNSVSQGANLIQNSNFVGSAYSWVTPPSDLVLVPWNDGRIVYAERSKESVHMANQSVCYSGWSKSNMIPVDPNLSYIFSIWIKSTSPTMANYFGFYVYDVNGVRITDDWNNPYFKGSRGDGNIWVYQSAYLLANATANSSTFNVAATNALDWVLPANAAYVVLRFGSCYSTGLGTAETYFAYPSVQLLEPATSAMLQTQIDALLDFQQTQANLVMDSTLVNDGSKWSLPPANIVSMPWSDGRPVLAVASPEVFNSTGCYSWARTNSFLIDPLATYEIGIWINSNGRDMANYLGFYVYDETGARITGAWDNPYFKTGRGDKSAWTYFSGYLLPFTTSNSSTVPISATNGVDWVFPSNARSALVRFGSCYADGDGLNTTYFAYPTASQVHPSSISVLRDDVAELMQSQQSQGNMVASPTYLGDTSTWLSPASDLVQVPWTDGRLVLAQRSKETVHLSNQSVCYPGWSISNMIPVDPRLSYQFSIWVRTTSTTMANYFGFYVYDANGNSIGGDWTNPYFKGSRGDLNMWEYHSGYLLANATANASTFNVPETDGVDWVLPSNAASVVLRFGSCYSTGKGIDETYFASPSVVVATLDDTYLINSKIDQLSSSQSTTANMVTFSSFYNPSNAWNWMTPPTDIVASRLNGTTILAQRSQETNHNASLSVCYPGWAKSNLVPVSPALQYEFSIWISSNGTDIANYFGFYLYDNASMPIGDAYANPYFKSSRYDPITWTKWTANLLPAGSVATGLDWVMPTNAAYALLRFGSCYGDGVNNNAALYALPSIRLVTPCVAQRTNTCTAN